MQQNTGNFLCKLIARKIHHFFFSFTLVLLFSVASAHAAGYSCPTYKKYTSCNAGYYMTNSSGTYNGTPAVGNSCTICPKGSYCTGGTANKVACAAGRYGSTTGLKTSTCTGVISAGRYGAAGATSASGSGAVSAGYYSTGGGTSATPTAAGNGCLSSYSCGKVSAGCYTSGTGSTKACPNSCVANATTSSTGATSVSSCICKAGYSGDASTTSGTCTACSAGYYKSSAGNTSCSAAGTGYYVSSTASTTRSACTNYRANTSTTGTTSTSTSQCLCKAGYYLNGSTCTACSTGTYKSAVSNATSCTTAGSGYYVSSTGASSQSACTSWRANTNTNGATGSTSTSACVCKAGYYLNGSTCTACSTGTYKSANSNATSCTTASSGYYVSSTGASSQSACTSWRANTNTNGATGSTSTSACVCKAGTYLNGSTCTSCGAGTYKSANSNATSCTSCTTTSGWTTTTSGTGSTAYTACYQTQTPSNCASGTIKRTASSLSGTTITYGTASVTSALSSNAGYYVNGTSCTVCPNGKFYGGGTATSCTSCPSLTSGYSYVSGTGWTSYSSCKEQMRPTNCYSGYLTKTATSATAWGAATNNITAKGGYKVSGSGDSATCSACGYGSYSANGATSCTACPTADSGWTAYSTSNASTSYSACYEYKSGTNISSYCSAGQLRRAASSASAYSTTVTISTALQAKAGAYVNGQTCTQCSGAVWSAGGTATSCSACPDQTSGWTRGTGTGWSAVTSCYQTKAATAVSSYCYSGQLKQNATSTTAWGTATVSTAFTADKGSYVSGSGANTTCTQCAAGTYQGTDGSTATSCSACSGRTKYSAKGASACSDVGTGYYTTGCNSSGNNCTGRTQCSGSTYCESGVQKNCPTAETNWTLGTGTGWSAVTSCFETRAATNVSSYCSAGQLKKNATSTTAWGSASISVAFQAKAGSIVSGQTCTQCAGGKYSAGGTATSCTNVNAGCYADTAGSSTACPKSCSSLGGGLYINSVAGSDADTDCYFTTTGGKYITASTDTAQTTCPAKSYCPATKLYYPNVGGIQSCPDATSSTYKETLAEMDWLTERCPTATTSNSSLTASNYQTWSNTGLSAITQCPATMTVSTPCANFNIESARYNSTTERYDSDVGSVYTGNVKAGYYLQTIYSSTYCSTSTNRMLYRKAVVCPAGSYCPGGSVPQCSSGTYNDTWGANACTSLGSFYTTSSAGATAATSCSGKTTAGNYIATANSGQVTCAAGGYCPGNVTVAYGSTGGRTGCGAGKYNASTGSSASSACANITAGCYGTSATSACPAVCATDKWSATGASSCSSCPTDYKNSGDTAASHANQASCKITVSGGKYIGTAGDNTSNWDTCSAGYYKAQHTVAYGSTSACSACGAVNKYSSSGAAACSTVSTGYYTTGGTTTTRTGQSQCTSGTYCTGGEQKTCPSGYGASAAGSDAAADCYMSVAAKNYVKTANDSSATACGGGTYKAAHTVYYGGTSTCSSCPSGYDDGAAVATQGECIISVAGGKYVGTANSATLSSCTGGTYKAAHTVKYGATSSCGQCPANSYCPAGASAATACSTLASGFYPNSAAGSDAAADCKTNSISGKYVKTANDSSATSCTGGTYKGSHQVNYGSTSSCGQCPANSYCPAGASAATACSTLASGFYPNSAAGSDAAADCKTNSISGKYVKTANDSSATSCTGGTYKGSHQVNYGSTSSCGQCPANSYCPAGASAATACSTLASGFYPNSAAGSDAAADCKTNSISGKYVKAANDSSATTCSCGTYKGAHQVNYGSTSSCTKTTAGYYAAEGASSQTKASAGYYAAAGACTQTKIQAGCFGGEGSSVACPNSCPAAESGWTLTSTTGLKVVTDCTETTTPSTSGSPIATICTAGTLTKKATSATAWGSATASGLTAKAGRYVNGTTCSACAAGTYTSAATTATSCTSASKGYYVSATEATKQTQCPAGTYGSTTGLKTSACSGKCTAGYYCPAGSASATQNECTAGNYCPAGAGAQTSCATVGGKLYVNSATKSDEATDCYISLASKVYLASATSTSTTTCTAGYYCPGGDFYYSSGATYQGRSSCTGATYSGSGAASCSNCPSGYTANTSNNKTAATSCQISCAAGTRVAEKNAQCTSPAGAWYSAATTTNYGSVSPVNYCMADYTSSSTAASGHDAKSDCVQTVAGGKYVGSTKISARYIKVTTAGSTANDGSHVVEIQAFAANDGTGTNLLSGKGGVSGSSMTNATDGSWSKDKYASGTMVWDMGSAQSIGSIKFALYTDGRVYSDVTVSVSTDNSTWTTVLGPVDIATQSASTAVGELLVLSAAPANCAAGTARASGTLALGSTNSCSVCGTSTYSNAGAASCTACATAKGYTNSGTTAASHAGTASCKATCGAGQYVATAGAGCVNVGAGYWGAGGTVGQNTTLGRTACGSGLTTIGYGVGANEAADCGRKLHAGDNVIYLRSAKRGDTALNVKIGNQTFFGALSTTYSSPLKVKKGTTEYSVVNDWQ